MFVRPMHGYECHEIREHNELVMPAKWIYLASNDFIVGAPLSCGHCSSFFQSWLHIGERVTAESHSTQVTHKSHYLAILDTLL